MARTRAAGHLRRQDGTAKYILGPVEVPATRSATPTSGYQTNQQGNVTSEVEIALSLERRGRQAVRRHQPQAWSALPEPQNQFAIVARRPRSSSAPRFNEAILDGRASITGGFTLDSARSLANQLKFGALPLSFDEQTEQRDQPRRWAASSCATA